MQVLYNLCEWPSRKGSRLAVIGIANTLDLPERLMPRIASRLGSRRVVFQPYKREQLQAIISQRLIDAGVAQAFEDNAIKYAASKVGFPAPLLEGDTRMDAGRWSTPQRGSIRSSGQSELSLQACFTHA